MGAPGVGSRILHYTILRAIGSGGMGVVYEAEDTKLGRHVALKFLPADLARDQPSLERFQREARAASALNHPNICTIHAIEAWEGEHFIAMELLDGESLDRRLAERPLAWGEIVDMGIQIADALDAAHQRGIVHRDIKPANIFLTREGRAKVLDFGVAKVSAAAGSGQTETRAVTPSEVKLTGPGVTVGTIAYMSPEQARGDELDARTDLFSLAAVLYEVSTGRPAFQGRTSAVIFQQILAGTSEAPRSINPALPPKLEDVIVKGLEKDRDLRYQTAAELRGDLKRLKRDASAGTLAFTPAATGAAVAPASSGAILAAEVRRRKGLVATSAVLMLALLGAAGYGLYAMLRSSPAQVARPGATMTVSRLTTSGDVRACGSISPDGKYVVYCDMSGRLHARQVATGSTVLLGEVDGATTFSRDGNFVYVSASGPDYPHGVLWEIPIFGGDRRRVITGMAGAAAVSPDGQRIAFLRPQPASREVLLMTAALRGGDERTLAKSSVDSSWFATYGVSWSHDGRFISATQETIVGGYRMRPVVIDATTGEIKTAGAMTWPDMGRTAWLPGNAILLSARERAEGPYQFWTVQFPDGVTTRVTGDDVRGFGNVSVSVTADGSTIATVPWDIVSNIWSVTADGTAAPEQWTSGLREDGLTAVVGSANGVFYGSVDGSTLGIWRVDAPGGRPRKLTQQEASHPSIPADGRFVTFEALHEGRYRIWRMEADGSDARVITRGEDDIRHRVSPDGRWVYYETPEGLMRVPADGGTATRIGSFRPRLIDLSPDGRRILAWAPVEPPDKGDPGPVLLDADTGALVTRLQLKLDGIDSDNPVHFGRTSDAIAYARTQDRVSNIWEQPLAGGPPKPLTKFTSGLIFWFAYSTDRTRLFLARGTRTGDMVLIRNFR